MRPHAVLRTARCLLLTLLALGAGAAPARAQGWLAGASAGTAIQQDYSVGGEIAGSDDSDTAFRVFGGYLFTPHLGAVLSYVDLGEANYDGPAFGGFTDTLGADGFDVSFVGGFAPGEQKTVTLFGTVGFFRWSQDVRYEDPSGVYVYDDSGTSLSFGAGVELRFGSAAQWGVHFTAQRFTDVGDEDNSGHEYDRDFFSVGANFRFGR